jgi:enoyl-CoA hydratase
VATAQTPGHQLASSPAPEGEPSAGELWSRRKRKGGRVPGWETIVYEVVGNVARIIMNRPDKRNAESFQLIDERDGAFREAERDPEVRVVVLGAAGPSFSAGHDLSEIAGDERMAAIRSRTETRVEFEQRFYVETALRIQRFSKPTIAMVQGACVAAGFVTAAMCDLIVASEDARFRDPLLGFATLPGEGRIGAASTEVFFHPWQLPVRIAKEMLFTGGWLDANSAREFGFVNRVVPREALEAETMTLANKVAEASPAAAALIKRSIQYSQDLMGQAASYEHHFLIHQLRHDGLGDGWLRTSWQPPGTRFPDGGPVGSGSADDAATS